MRGLARLGLDDRWYPLPPHDGLLPLLTRAQEQLVRGRELFDRLAVEYQRVHEGHRVEEVVQAVQGADAVRSRLDAVLRGARTELLVFASGGPDPAEPELPGGRAVPGGRAGGGGRPGHGGAGEPGGSRGAGGLERPGGRAGPAHPPGPAHHPPGWAGAAGFFRAVGSGVPDVRRRVVVERAAAQKDPDGAQGALDALPPDADVRVVDRLPVRMCVADHAVALVPLGADARSPEPAMLVIGASGLLDALVALFESVWSGGVPLARPGAGAGTLQQRILAMLVMGSTDAAMARSLGVAVRTVQRRIAAMQRTAGVDNRIQLVWHAARNGWLD
ncbi:putative transcriptional regulator [Actinacidiphila reveromycinica]|uniref:Putative transcriptional regulator n=1 Tax=Actinacidiphila reveromycinica TaxID=659352 RepID=A0A7U3ULY8_9ACTN|nr:putative transcriptional regulator [Streptomyces sp. SN-593]